MPSNWKKYTVKELIDQKIIDKPIDGNHGEIHPKGNDFVELGIPFIMATDISNGQVNLKNCKFISRKQGDSLRKGFAKEGDVLLTHKASIGRTAIVPKSEFDYIMLTPQVTYYRVLNKEKLNNQYLMYYFNSTGFQCDINMRAGSGSTRAYIGITDQQRLEIVLPPLSEQRAIASILSALDDKIELNLQMNKTLEEMAMAVYKHWFVENIDSNELKEYLFEEVLEFIVDNRGKTVPTANEGIPLIATNCVKNENIFPIYSNLRYISDETYKNWFRAHPLEGDILFVNKGTPGCVNLVPNPVDFCIAQDMIAMRVNQKKLTKYFFFLYLRTPLVQFEIQNKSVGTTIPHLKKTDLLKFKIAVPEITKLQDFEKLVAPIFEKINCNRIENSILTQKRNSLLPKLIGGEITINA